MSGIKYKDLSGQRFGKLTVMYEAERGKNGRRYWHCKCDCGREKDITTYSLTSGNTKSCGCVRGSGRPKGSREVRPYRDLSGETFGNLTVIEPTGERKNNFIMWRCRCVCGKITEVTSSNLLSGNSTSCGCQRDKGKYWKIQSPSGDVYEFENLSRFIREHQDLFCGNARNISAAFAEMKRSQNGKKESKLYQWKGWKLLDWK